MRKIKDLLAVQSNALQSEHLITAVRLPSGHAVRKPFAKATMTEFVLARKRRRPFKFETELKELEGYAADLLGTCGGVFRDCYGRVHDSGRVYSVSRDPFTDNDFWIRKVSKRDGRVRAEKCILIIALCVLWLSLLNAILLLRRTHSVKERVLLSKKVLLWGKCYYAARFYCEKGLSCVEKFSYEQVVLRE